MSPYVKRKKEKFKLPTRYWLLILTCISAILMGVTFLTDYSLAPANVIVGYTIVPFQKGLTQVGTFFYDKVQMMNEIKELQAENEKLKAENDELTIENTNLLQDKYELNSLRELYALDEEYSEYEKTGAKVIMGGTDNWFNTFVIDKGSNDGIEVDMNVMAGSGLVGRITEVGPNWSRVLSVIDDSSNISGMILSTSDTLIVSGSLESMSNGYITFDSLKDKKDAVVVGDKIVTSNISDKYLPGILIGYVSMVETDSNNLTKSGYLTPVVDFGHLREVLVITKKKQTIE